jgi:hypothetical protein
VVTRIRPRGAPRVARCTQSLALNLIGEHVDGIAPLSTLRVRGAEYAESNQLGEPRPLRSIDFGARFPTR